jgi:hypothetical protein
MKRSLLLVTLIIVFGCSKPEYRFERIDGDQPVALPLKFEGLYGIRDGAQVKAEGHFADANDSVTMNVVLFLRPPAEFQSGAYQAVIGGKKMSGSVECPSLTFQGGQTALPTVGGVFVLKDEQNRPLYRVTIPAMQLQRR